MTVWASSEAAPTSHEWLFKINAKELCSVFFQLLWMVAILLSDVVVSLVSLRMYISYHMYSYVILNDFLMVNGCFGAFHGDVLGRYGMDQFHRFHPLNTRTSVQRLYL